MAVQYSLRDDVAALILCLYDPLAASAETRYTFSSLLAYVQDCGYQLENGEPIRRFPYHLAPCKADANRAQADFQRALSALRKANKKEEPETESSTAWLFRKRKKV